MNKEPRTTALAAWKAYDEAMYAVLEEMRQQENAGAIFENRWLAAGVRIVQLPERVALKDALTSRPTAGDARVANNVVGTCDWGNCDGETVGVRLDQDGEWLAVCAQHSEICRAMDAIWRLTCLPFSDNDRRQIQGIALAWIDGQGPKPGSQVAQWLAALEAPAPTTSGEAQ